MIRYGKTARQAVAALSYVAERESRGEGPVSSAQVGEARKMPAPLAAKLLSEMASAGLAVGTTGPGGGYRLARPAELIRLADIVYIFERKMEEYPCPFGPGWCGKGAPCPLHHHFEELEGSSRQFLEETTLAVFTAKRKSPARKKGA